MYSYNETEVVQIMYITQERRFCENGDKKQLILFVWHTDDDYIH